MKEQWRVGKREGQALWQIKAAPNWAVAHHCVSLQEAAAWLTERGVDLHTVSVIQGWPRRSLAEHIENPEDR